MFRKIKETAAVLAPPPKYRVEILVKIVDQELEDATVRSAFRYSSCCVNVQENFTIKANTFSEVTQVLQKFYEAAEVVKRCAT